MGYRYGVAVDGIGGLMSPAGGVGIRPVAHKLVSEEVKVHPGFVAAPFAAAQQSTVKCTGLLDVANFDGQVKGR
jgi:hypothetical protein